MTLIGVTFWLLPASVAGELFAIFALLPIIVWSLSIMPDWMKLGLQPFSRRDRHLVGRRRAGNARRAFRRREFRSFPERFSGRTYRTGDSGHRLVFHYYDIAGPEGNRRVAHSGVAGSGVDRERRVMRPCGGAHLPAFTEQGNFGRARIVRLPSCMCGRAREAGKTPRAGVSGAGESIHIQK